MTKFSLALFSAFLLALPKETAAEVTPSDRFRYLLQININRTAHDLPPLTWDDCLAYNADLSTKRTRGTEALLPCADPNETTRIMQVRQHGLDRVTDAVTIWNDNPLEAQKFLFPTADRIGCARRRNAYYCHVIHLPCFEQNNNTSCTEIPPLNASLSNARLTRVSYNAYTRDFPNEDIESYTPIILDRDAILAKLGREPENSPPVPDLAAPSQETLESGRESAEANPLEVEISTPAGEVPTPIEDTLHPMNPPVESPELPVETPEEDPTPSTPLPAETETPTPAETPTPPPPVLPTPPPPKPKVEVLLEYKEYSRCLKNQGVISKDDLRPFEKLSVNLEACARACFNNPRCAAFTSYSFWSKECLLFDSDEPSKFAYAFNTYLGTRGCITEGSDRAFGAAQVEGEEGQGREGEMREVKRERSGEITIDAREGETRRIERERQRELAQNLSLGAVLDYLWNSLFSARRFFGGPTAPGREEREARQGGQGGQGEEGGERGEGEEGGDRRRQEEGRRRLMMVREPQTLVPIQRPDELIAHRGGGTVGASASFRGNRGTVIATDDLAIAETLQANDFNVVSLGTHTF